MPAEGVCHELPADSIPINSDLRSRRRMIDRLAALQTPPEANAHLARIVQQSEHTPPYPHAELLRERLGPSRHLVRMVRKGLPR